MASPYLDYFGFREDPFSLTPNPAYFYLTRQHELALEELMRGVDERKGIMLLIGEMGTGKTILLRTLEKSIPEGVLVSYQLNPSLDFTDIVKKMLSDMGIPCDTDSRARLISFCHEKLGELGRKGQYALLILDEAQSLSEAVLEDIRILSNIEDPGGKLLNVVLAGQPELFERISVSSLRSLKHRIGVRVYLKPMDADEVSRYLEHRLKVAGWQATEPLFTKDSLSWFSYSSNGNPRLINIIADNALHRAYRDRIHSVDKEIMRRTLAGLEGREPVGKKRERRFSLREANPLAIAFIILLVVLLVYFFSTMRERRERRSALRETGSPPAESFQALTPRPETVFVREGPSPVAERAHPASAGMDTSAAPAAPPLREVFRGEGITGGEEAAPPDAVEPLEADAVREERARSGSVRPSGEASRGDAPRPPGEIRAKQEGGAGSEVKVEEGDCLSRIIEREYGRSSWKLLQEVLDANRGIENPDHIIPGQKIFLPGVEAEE